MLEVTIHHYQPLVSLKQLYYKVLNLSLRIKPTYLVRFIFIPPASNTIIILCVHIYITRIPFLSRCAWIVTWCNVSNVLLRVATFQLRLRESLRSTLTLQIYYISSAYLSRKFLTARLINGLFIIHTVSDELAMI